MDTILSGFIRAVRLIFSLDAELFLIIGLSLKVSAVSVLAASAMGVPLGALCALKRFLGRSLFVTLLNSLMGLPPVVAGLALYLILSRSGPLGFMGLLFSPSAMIIAQTVIVMPIIAALTWSAVGSVDPRVRETALTLGAGPLIADWRVVCEARLGVLSAVMAGLGRALAEVGAVLMVGGNIAGYTRVMTTAIAMETGKGSFELATALGIILLVISFVIYLVLGRIQGPVRAV